MKALHDIAPHSGPVLGDYFRQFTDTLDPRATYEGTQTITLTDLTRTMETFRLNHFDDEWRAYWRPGDVPDRDPDATALVGRLRMRLNALNAQNLRFTDGYALTVTPAEFYVLQQFGYVVAHIDRRGYFFHGCPVYAL